MATPNHSPSVTNLESIADELEADYELLVRRFSLGVFRRLTRMSPVDTGRFKGNWILSIDKIDSSASEQNEPTPRGSEAPKAVFRADSELTKFDIDVNSNIYIQNNLPYAQRLNSGYSQQAPSGFVQMAIDEELTVLK